MSRSQDAKPHSHQIRRRRHRKLVLPRTCPAMPAEIFNANPTIYASSKSHTRKSNLDNGRSLWIEDVQDVEDDSDEVEPIDQDEIFGGRIYLTFQSHHYTCLYF